MRIIIQRVLDASLFLENQLFSKIDKGIIVYIGIGETDSELNIDAMSSKVCNLKIFEDEKGHLGKSLLEINGDLLIVSNFTLYADSKKNKLSFSKAAKPDSAERLYDLFIEKLSKSGVQNIKTGQFGKYMTITSTNDGPVNLIIESE